jgi:hypothetical protein
MYLKMLQPFAVPQVKISNPHWSSNTYRYIRTSKIACNSTELPFAVVCKGKGGETSEYEEMPLQQPTGKMSSS